VTPGISADVGPATTPMEPADGYPQAPNGDGTYPYDGGPSNPVPTPQPMPKANPMAVPTRTVPMDGIPVALPKTGSKWSYPAYGEKPRRTSTRTEQDLLTRR
jgi:hypothetical protein